jgi:hypothetical protein
MSSGFPAAPAAIDVLLAEADRRYLARDWASALALYGQIGEHDPERVDELALPIGIGHCRIELADMDAIAGLALHPGPCPESARVTGFITKARHRALELCRAGDAARAARLLRFLGGFDWAIAETYAHNIDREPLGWTLRAPDRDDSPQFLAATGLSDDAVAAARQRHRGRRVLLAVPRYLSRHYEVIDNLVRSGERFGLVVQEFQTHLGGRAPDDYASTLLAAILEFKPDVLYYCDLFETDPAAFSPDIAAQVSNVLALARATLGVRVVRYLTDAWRTAMRVGGDLFVGLGSCVDLLHHQAPLVLGVGTDAQRSAAFCYPTPCHLPGSQVDQGAIPRACFVGRIHEWAYARAVWWAECSKLGLPIDWRVQMPWDTAQLADPPASDQHYADLLRGYAVSINFTSRLNRVRILTARSLETLLSGGVVLEEATPDTAYFLKPGRHYLTFETLADLAEMIPALVADRPRRLALADAGQRWVAKYFDGDYFWAGLLDKLATLG